MLLFVIIMFWIELFLICVFAYRYSSLSDSYISKKKEWVRIKNELSMVEYCVRCYREGENPYTVLREIEDILRKEEDNQ